MKRGALFFLFGLGLVVFCASLVLAGDDFEGYCDNDGCYIDSCGVQIEDIAYIINYPGEPQCTTSTYCSGNVIMQRVDGGTEDDLSGGNNGGPDASCYDLDWPTFCEYQVEVCPDGCFDGPGGASCCAQVTCDDFAAQGVCGENLDAGCGMLLNCTDPRANGATCNVSTGTFYCADASYANCNGDWVDGCEAVLESDANNCGSCGNSCDAQFMCIDGSCEGNEWHNLIGERVDFVDVGDYVRLQSPYIGTGRTYTIVDGNTTLDTAYALDYYQVTQTPEAGLQFKVNGVANEYSNVLGAGYSPGGGIDSPFATMIEDPICGAVFNAGTSVAISIEVIDADDIITGTITYGGNNYTFDNIYSTTVNLTYASVTPGNLQVLVTANNTRGKQYRAISNVMVYDSFNTSTQYYVAACIDSPANFDTFSSSTVFFNASSSRGLMYTGSGTDSGGSFSFISPDDLFFSWSFLYAGSQYDESSCVGLGSEPCAGDVTPGATKYLFTKIFPTVNDNYAFLTVSIP